jgi:hypothetical protein
MESCEFVEIINRLRVSTGKELVASGGDWLTKKKRKKQAISRNELPNTDIISNENQTINTVAPSLHHHTTTPSHHHAITPSHHHTITPPHHHTITPSRHHTITPSRHHTITPSHNHTTITPHQHAITPSHYHTMTVTMTP